MQELFEPLKLWPTVLKQVTVAGTWFRIQDSVSLLKICLIKPFALSLVKLKTISFAGRKGFNKGFTGTEDAECCV
jgi:hypothetical protein